MDLKITDTKIENLQGFQKNTQNTKTEEFKFTLNKLSNDNLMEKLNSLIKDITIQGNKLSEHMDIRDMKNYRSLITEFMNEIVSNSHSFSRENFLDRRGRHRVYGIVKLINKELDELAQQLIQNQKNQIVILDKTGAILGLLLDLII